MGSAPDWWDVRKPDPWQSMERAALRRVKWEWEPHPSTLRIHRPRTAPPQTSPTYALAHPLLQESHPPNEPCPCDRSRGYAHSVLLEPARRWAVGKGGVNCRLSLSSQLPVINFLPILSAGDAESPESQVGIAVEMKRANHGALSHLICWPLKVSYHRILDKLLNGPGSGYDARIRPPSPPSGFRSSPESLPRPPLKMPPHPRRGWKWSSTLLASRLSAKSTSYSPQNCSYTNLR